MSIKYRICLVLPDQNPHALCFREVGLLLLCTLKSNGFECDFTFNQPAEDRINIMLGYHLLTFEEGLKNFRYIPYQLEQLHTKEFPFSENMEKILRHASEVWDYSEKNIAFLKDLGIEAKHLVPGYHPQLELIPTEPRQTVDVLFYGSIGDRRREVLGQLSEKSKLKTLFSVYGEKRDKWICRSKIILNVHHYSKQIFEAVRVSYLLNNRCFIISENSVNYCYDKVELTMTPYEEIVETCVKFLNQPDRMEAIRNQNYEDFKKHYPMTESLARVAPVT
ncbi:MAG: hypothetical protein GY940_07335 [bacterium]|nr:hypothetical protein [bacterium]